MAIEFKYKSNNFLVMKGHQQDKFVLWINEKYPIINIPIFLTIATEELVKPVLTSDKDIIKYTRKRTYKGETYIPYIFIDVHKRPFYNDCLKFAEYLTRECDKRLDYKGKAPCQLCATGVDSLFEKETYNLFGYHRVHNYDLAEYVDDKDKNDNANPSVGENYAIIEGKNTVGLGFRYHIAHVVFKDVITMVQDRKVVEKTVNITLEADRGFQEKYEETKDKGWILKMPYFDCYSIVKEGPQKITTFHSTHCCEKKDPYFEPITIVLEPKGDDLVTKTDEYSIVGDFKIDSDDEEIEEITPKKEGKGLTKKKRYKSKNKRKTKKSMSRKIKRV